MTREGDETGEDTTEPVDNVIAFPGARVRPVPSEAPAPEVADEATREAAAEDRPVEEPGMTLDAFERAVRSAVREKLGDSPERPQGADELVAQVFSALTGKDAKTALSEVRQRLAEPATVDEGNDGDVIDLGAVREARQRASLESAQKIGSAIKDSFSQFLATLAQRQGARGTGEITLDASFFKQHGSALLGNLFQGLAATLMQQQKPAAPAPTPPSEPAAEGTEPAAAAPGADEPKAAEPRQVQVKLDLGSILSGLFRKRDTPEPPKD